MSVPSLEVLGVDIVKFLIDFSILYAFLLVISLTLNLEAGYAGVPNFGKVLFVAGGAAIAGSITGRLAIMILGIDTHGGYNVSIAKIISQTNELLSRNTILSIELLLLGVLLAAGVGAALGFLASYPAIRLREDYLGMLLLASAQFFQIFLGGYEPLIGGTQGILVPDLFRWAGSAIGIRDVVVLGFLAVFAGLVYLYAESLARSPLGRTLRAVRDDEVASRALGKNDVAIRRNVIIIASAISGMAGAFLTFYVGSVGAETWTRLAWTFPPWVIIIIGGASNNLGVAVGAFSYTLIFKIIDLEKFQFATILPFDYNWLQLLIFASLLIAFLFLRPGGIIPEKPTRTLSRRRLARIIESEVASEKQEGERSLHQIVMRIMWLVRRIGTRLWSKSRADG